MNLKTNITNLQEILDKVNNLPSSEPQENLEEELNTQSILLEEQNAKIAELANVLANKAGNKNTKYDTCTISIKPISGSLFGYCMTCFDDEKVVQKYNFSISNLGNVTISDVICGSTFSIIWDTANGEVSTNNLVRVNSIANKGAMYIAPTQPGTSSVIQIVSSNSGGGPIHGGGSN